MIALTLLLSLPFAVMSQSPQMGWNSWNKFACDISEQLIRDTADALVSTGLADLGYKYVNIDDCWQAMSRDEKGKVVPDATRFPSGMAALGDYIHSKGLKFGIYSSAGFKTCEAFPASLGLEDVDAATYAEWGVDYLKYDNCYTDHGLPINRYTAMSNALTEAYKTSDTSVFYSLCEWGRENPAVWASGIANSWRISGDISDNWQSIVTRAEITAPLWRYSGPALGWNDPDMLEVGNGGCTDIEYQTHFSLWAMLKAPLIIGNDVRMSAEIRPATIEILSNKEVIAVNQDVLGKQAKLVWSDLSDYSDNETSTKKGSLLSGGDKLIATQCAADREDDDEYGDSPIDQEWLLQRDGTVQSAATKLCLHELDGDGDGGGTGGGRGDWTRASSIILSNYTTENGQFEDKVSWLHTMHRNNAVTTSECSTATKWDVGAFVGGSIVSRSSGLCLEVSKEDLLPLWQGKRIQTSVCNDISSKQNFDVTEHQSWTTPNGGGIGGTGAPLRNLYQRQCLTVDRDAYSSTPSPRRHSQSGDGGKVGEEEDVRGENGMEGEEDTMNSRATLPMYSGEGKEVWAAPLQDGSVLAVLLVNKGDTEQLVPLRMSMLDSVQLTIKDQKVSSTVYALRDLWKHEDLSQQLTAGSDVSMPVAAHGVVMLKLSPLS